MNKTTAVKSYMPARMRKVGLFRRLAAVLTLLAAAALHAGWDQEALRQFKTPEPRDIFFERSPDAVISRDGYVLGYSEFHEQPLWVVYVLTRERAVPPKSGRVGRSGRFRIDPEIWTGSAEPEDYAGTKFDRGHLAPSADMRWSKKVQDDSFYFSNISPQRPGFNRGVWKQLETAIRRRAARGNALLVISGPVLSGRNRFYLPRQCFANAGMGKNHVTIPSYYYKVVISLERPDEVEAFLLPNRSTRNSARSFAVPLDTVESATGLDMKVIRLVNNVRTP